MAIEQVPPTAAPPPPAPQKFAAPAPDFREAFVLNARVQAGRVIGAITMLGLLVGLIGGLGTRSETSIFDLAASRFEVYKPGFGYVIGPALVAIAWPNVRKWRGVAFSFAHRYRTRIVIAALLWVTGLVVLIAGVSGLSDAYTVKTGTYVAAALMSVGLLSTLAMWPTGLKAVHATKNGEFQEAVEATPPASLPGAPEAGPPANWYEDPLGEARLRYWDGHDWTSYTSG